VTQVEIDTIRKKRPGLYKVGPSKENWQGLNRGQNFNTKKKKMLRLWRLENANFIYLKKEELTVRCKRKHLH